MRQKKIGIVTLHGFDNYGSALQAKSLQHVLTGMGYTPEAINLRLPVSTPCSLSMLRHIARSVFRVGAYIRFINRCRYGKLYQAELTRLYEKYCEFYAQLNASESYENYEQFLKKRTDEYDAFIVGSDQVWNPLYYCNIWPDFMMLAFAPPEKRISYAASMGVTQLPQSFVPYYTEKLKEFAYISVREDTAKALVEELTGRSDVEHVLDPSLLLDRDEWDQLSDIGDSKAIIPNEPYVLCYALTKHDGNSVARKCLRAAKQLGIGRVVAASRAVYEGVTAHQEGITPVFAGPNEFVQLLLHAEAVVADSFHATAFAINFRKPFIFIGDQFRKGISLNSRVVSLLHLLQIPERIVYSVDEAVKLGLKMDYSHVDPILEQWRRKSLSFLSNALEKCTNEH